MFCVALLSILCLLAEASDVNVPSLPLASVDVPHVTSMIGGIHDSEHHTATPIAVYRDTPCGCLPDDMLCVQYTALSQGYERGTKNIAGAATVEIIDKASPFTYTFGTGLTDKKMIGVIDCQQKRYPFCSKPTDENYLNRNIATWRWTGMSPNPTLLDGSVFLRMEADLHRMFLQQSLQVGFAPSLIAKVPYPPASGFRETKCGCLPKDMQCIIYTPMSLVNGIEPVDGRVNSLDGFTLVSQKRTLRRIQRQYRLQRQRDGTLTGTVDCSKHNSFYCGRPTGKFYTRKEFFSYHWTFPNAKPSISENGEVVNNVYADSRAMYAPQSLNPGFAMELLAKVEMVSDPDSGCVDHSNEL